MNSYKLKVVSDFHGPSMCEIFARIEEGDNIRRLKQRRGRYCLDYSSANSNVCGCGFPCARSTWSVFDSDGNEVENAEVQARECGQGGEDYGRGYIRINLFIKPEEV